MAAGVAVALAAPGEAVDPARPITQCSHRVWQDELPQTTVHAILQSSDGYLWAATYDGLVRFDGVRFEVLDSSSTPALPGSSVLALHEDRMARLWVGTNQGLAVVEGDGCVAYGVADGLPGERVVWVGEAPGGEIWVGTTAGPARFDGSFFHPLPVAGLGTGVVRQVRQGAAGRFWLCTDDGVLAVEPNGLTAERQLAGVVDGPCQALVVARDGTVWAGTRSGLAYRRGDTDGLLTTADGLPSSNVRVLLEDRHGSLWVGTQDAGVARLADGRASVFRARHGLSHNLVRALHEDREGSVWVGTNSGLDQLREAKVTAHSTRSGLSNDFVRAVLEDARGAIWIGTDGGGLNRYLDGQLEVPPVNELLPSSSVRAIAEGPGGSLWLGTRAGVCRLEGDRVTTWTRRDGLSSDLIRVVYPDADGTVWVGTEGGGLNHLAGGSVEVLTTADGLAGDDVRALLRDRRGRLWVATIGGASVLVPGQPVRSFGTRDGLPDPDVYCFLEDRRGNLWIGGEGGLTLLRDGSFSVVTTAHGLADSDVYWILDDGRGNLWTSSNRGVSRLDLESLYAVVDGRASRVEGETFDTSHGMPTNHCNGVSQPAGWRTRDGRLWFPTTRGAVEVDPAHLVHNELPPPVLLERVVVDGTPLSPAAALAIPPGRHRYELHYTALSFAAPERVLFRYRLEGFDGGWTAAGTRRVAYYSTLPPGSFTFRVMACNNDGVWNEQGVSFRFRVLPSWWETWWARALLLLVVGAVLLVGHGARVRALARANLELEAKVALRTAELDDKNAALAEKVEQLEESERQAHAAERRALEANRAKSLFLSTMSHELRTPLNAIIGFASILLQRLEGSLEPRHATFLGHIHASGLHLLGLINDLLDLAKIEAGRMELALEDVDLRQVAEGVCRLIQGVSDKRQIGVDLELAPDLPELRADPVRLKQILFNLLSNAVKFSPDGARVTVAAGRLDAAASPLQVDSVRVDVVDRGIGIAPEHHRLIFEEFRQVDSGSGRRFEGTGLGLPLVKSLVVLHGGTVTVDSELGRGSTFTVILPVDGTAAALALVGSPERTGS